MKLRKLLDGLELPYLYHATFEELLPSIKKRGLDPSVKNKSWSFSGNYVYLSGDKDVAESYAEIADNREDAYDKKKVIFEIKVSDLDKDKLSVDGNNRDGENYQYSGVIPYSKLKRVK